MWNWEIEIWSPPSTFSWCRQCWGEITSSSLPMFMPLLDSDQKNLVFRSFCFGFLFSLLINTVNAWCGIPTSFPSITIPLPLCDSHKMNEIEKFYSPSSLLLFLVNAINAWRGWQEGRRQGTRDTRGQSREGAAGDGNLKCLISLNRLTYFCSS